MGQGGRATELLVEHHWVHWGLWWVAVLCGSPPCVCLCAGQRAGVTHGAQWRATPPVIPSAGTATASASWPGAPAASAW